MSDEPLPTSGLSPRTSPTPIVQPSGAPVQVDPAAISETDSAYGEDETHSYTTSMTESVTKYEYEYGRRYHAYRKGSYILPNDEQEKDRLDMMHHLITIRLDNRLHLAPISQNLQRVLDLGTGTGIWAIEMGMHTLPRKVPPNVRFEIDDIENEWVYSSSFDFIHCRAMAAAIADWPHLVAQSFKYTKPGGWVEFADFDMKVYSSDGSLSEDNPLSKWNTNVLEAARMIGREPNPGPLLAGFLRDANFVSVKEEVYRIPIGTWPKDEKLKEVGAFNYMQLLEGLEGFTLALFTRVLGWSVDEVHVLLASVRTAVKSRAIHAQYNLHVVYAQRPVENTV